MSTVFSPSQFITPNYSSNSTKTAERHWATLLTSNQKLINEYKGILKDMVGRSERARGIQALMNDLNASLLAGPVSGAAGLADSDTIKLLWPSHPQDDPHAFIARLANEGARTTGMYADLYYSGPTMVISGYDTDPFIAMGMAFATAGTVRMWLVNLQDTVDTLQQADSAETFSMKVIQDQLVENYDQIRSSFRRTHDTHMQILGR